MPDRQAQESTDGRCFARQALLFENNRAGYRQLLRELQAARKEHADDLVEAAHAMARAYCNFAWQQRELHEVMHRFSGATIHR